jgi:hypothetical protein
MARRSHQRSAGALMPGGTLARARVVQAPHLLLADLILGRRLESRRRGNRGFGAVITQGMD